MFWHPLRLTLTLQVDMTSNHNLDRLPLQIFESVEKVFAYVGSGQDWMRFLTTDQRSQCIQVDVQKPDKFLAVFLHQTTRRLFGFTSWFDKITLRSILNITLTDMLGHPDLKRPVFTHQIRKTFEGQECRHHYFYSIKKNFLCVPKRAVLEQG